jgi:hypothetical protein
MMSVTRRLAKAELLRAVREDPDPDVRGIAITQLVESGHATLDVIHALMQAARHDPEAYVRVAAIHGLGTLGRMRPPGTRSQLSSLTLRQLGSLPLAQVARRLGDVTLAEWLKLVISVPAVLAALGAIAAHIADLAHVLGALIGR